MKIGDKVVCIDDADTRGVIRGANYIISNVERIMNGVYVELTDISRIYYKNRFVKDNKLNREIYNIKENTSDV